MDYGEYFKRKKVTVMRIGLLGRGVGDTAYMAEVGAEVTVVDFAPQEVMQPSVDALAQYENVTFKFGPYDFADFKDADFVLVGAGTPMDEPVLLACKEADIALKQSASLFAELSGIPIVGITGTRGKSTVTHMIHHTLCSTFEGSVLLGGNVRGLSNLQLLKQVEEDSIAVMELDSWQLQGFGWAKISPQVAVFTNFMEDHLNYYTAGGRSHDEAMSLYFADKANIFKYQNDHDTLVTTPGVFEWAKKIPRAALGQEVVLVDGSIIPDDAILAMPGEHNRLNAALAYKALEALGLTEEEIFAGLASFPGVEGRLQYLGEVKGIKIYNDNNSTTPAATVVGLQALGTKEKNIVLIIGGDEKNLDMNNLLLEIPKWCSKVILFKERGTERITAEVLAMQEKYGIEVYEEEGLEATVQQAFAVAKPGEVILYSPGFSSFGKYFKNEFDRGDQFVRLVDTFKTEL